jgi:aryl-alcohol dehydrogenase-like predicted oxidoreductase
MRYRTLGSTGLSVSEIGFGAWAIGAGSGKGVAYGPVRDEESIAAIRKSLDLGITLFDTADVYGHGHSETLLGQTLPRDVVVASKVGYHFAATPIRSVFTRDHIVAACEAGLQRLRRDVIDVYQLHNPTEADLDALEVLQDLKKQGKIRFAGVSIATPAEARAAAARGADTIQLVYNYIDQDQRAALGCGPAIIVREPLSRGMLSGKFGADATFPESDIRSRYAPAEYRRRVQAAEEFRALKHPGLTMVQAALKFVLAEPRVGVVIPGIKTAAQAEENAAASDGRYKIIGDVFRSDEVESGLGGDA